MKFTALAVCIAAFAAIAGCRGTGTYAHVGDVTAPVEVSDSSDTINVRALFSMRGAKVWSAKDSIVAMTYTNDYTNSYLYGMVETRGRQNFGVNVNPCEVASGKGDEAEELSAAELTAKIGAATGPDAAAPVSLP